MARAAHRGGIDPHRGDDPVSVETRLKPFDREVLFDLAGRSPAEQSAALAEFARQEIAAAQAQNERALGHAVDYETFVDGARSAAFERVAPNGVIVAECDLKADLVQWIWETVQKHSPVLTGAFRASQRLYADGVEVAGPADVPTSADEIVIQSIVPYARKIERGESKQALDGVYEAAAAMASVRYGDQARIRFTFRSPIGGDTALETWAARHSAKAQGAPKQRRQFQADARQPAIVISFGNL
jgi:hypothetical protein